MELFNLVINELMRYRKNRVPARIYLPMALLLCTASLSAGWPSTPIAWVTNLFLAYTLLLQFRLWDDLCDVDQDRPNHPQRVLCQADSLVPFRWAVAALFAVNFTLLAVSKSWSVVAVFLVLNVGFLVWYRVAEAVRISNTVGYHFVLIKYPVFVYLIAPVEGGLGGASTIYAMALLYLCFCVYEILHDQRLHAIRGIVVLLAIEMVALQLVAALMVIRLGNFVEPLVALQLGLSIIGATVLLILFQRHRQHFPPGRWCYAVFLLGFALLLNYSFATFRIIEIGRSL